MSPNPRDQRLLLELDVVHGYFADPTRCDMDVLPDGAAQALFDGCGCIARPRAGGFSVIGDQQAMRAMKMRLDNDEDTTQFHLIARSRDAAFRNYTAGLKPVRPGIPCFDSRFAGRPDADGRRLMHRAEHVVDADSTAFDEPPLSGLLHPSERIRPPAFVATIGRDELLASINTDAPLRLRVRFAPRAFVWKYIFAGGWDEDIRVIDLDKVEAFDGPRREDAGRHRVLSVCSSQPIALRERPTSRFQLRQGRANDERVLIKRLPFASPHRLGGDSSGSSLSLFSEIHVNR